MAVFSKMNDASDSPTVSITVTIANEAWILKASNTYTANRMYHGNSRIDRESSHSDSGPGSNPDEQNQHEGHVTSNQSRVLVTTNQSHVHATTNQQYIQATTNQHQVQSTNYLQQQLATSNHSWIQASANSNMSQATFNQGLLNYNTNQHLFHFFSNLLPYTPIQTAFGIQCVHLTSHILVYGLPIIHQLGLTHPSQITIQIPSEIVNRGNIPVMIHNYLPPYIQVPYFANLHSSSVNNNQNPIMGISPAMLIPQYFPGAHNSYQSIQLPSGNFHVQNTVWHSVSYTPLPSYRDIIYGRNQGQHSQIQRRPHRGTCYHSESENSIRGFSNRGKFRQPMRRRTCFRQSFRHYSSGCAFQHSHQNYGPIWQSISPTSTSESMRQNNFLTTTDSSSSSLMLNTNIFGTSLAVSSSNPNFSHYRESSTIFTHYNKSNVGFPSFHRTSTSPLTHATLVRHGRRFSGRQSHYVSSGELYDLSSVVPTDNHQGLRTASSSFQDLTTPDTRGSNSSMEISNEDCGLSSAGQHEHLHPATGSGRTWVAVAAATGSWPPPECRMGEKMLPEIQLSNPKQELRISTERLHTAMNNLQMLLENLNQRMEVILRALVTSARMRAVRQAWREHGNQLEPNTLGIAYKDLEDMKDESED